MTRVSLLWDLIETWGFREDIKDIFANNANNNNDDEIDNNDKDNNNNKDGNNDRGISALGLDRDMGFLRGHQGKKDSKKTLTCVKVGGRCRSNEVDAQMSRMNK